MLAKINADKNPLRKGHAKTLSLFTNFKQPEPKRGSLKPATSRNHIPGTEEPHASPLNTQREKRHNVSSNKVQSYKVIPQEPQPTPLPSSPVSTLIHRNSKPTFSTNFKFGPNSKLNNDTYSRPLNGSPKLNLQPSQPATTSHQRKPSHKVSSSILQSEEPPNSLKSNIVTPSPSERPLTSNKPAAISTSKFNLTSKHSFNPTPPQTPMSIKRRQMPAEHMSISTGIDSAQLLIGYNAKNRGRDSQQGPKGKPGVGTPGEIHKSPPPAFGKAIKKSLANVIGTYYPPVKTNSANSNLTQTKDSSKKIAKLARSDFTYLAVVGDGANGQVWKVKHNKTGKLFAMKQMNKALVMSKKNLENVLNERQILECLRHGLVTNMKAAFSDRDNLYLLLQLLEGGDMREHMCFTDRFSEQETKFAVACVVSAVEYVHKHKIFHRDIKPENLVFDLQGYLHLNDFGIARKQTSTQPLDSSGTPGYMAPEVILRQTHSYTVDFYAIGILIYEMMFGKRPYNGVNRLQIRDAILAKQHQVRRNQVPSGWSSDVADFINKLIMRQPASRLGSKLGARQLKNHSWLRGFPWAQLDSRALRSPFKPLSSRIDIPAIEPYDEALMQFRLIEKTDHSLNDPFQNYDYTIASDPFE